MAFDVVMPQMGESIAEATVLKWHKQVGETIAKDETLYEISTDKVDAEIPAPASGTILEILVEVNLTVPVGTVVARIGSAEEKPSGAPAAAVPAPADLAASLPPAPAPLPDDDNSLEARLRTRSSPLVREMARQHGVDLTGLQGSGQAGRVTRNDLEDLLAKAGIAKKSCCGS
ncbi:MAG: biotin/lipoyl-containing protein, partial [Holophagaceae bacterium]